MAIPVHTFYRIGIVLFLVTLTFKLINILELFISEGREAAYRSTTSGWNTIYREHLYQGEILADPVFSFRLSRQI